MTTPRCTSLLLLLLAGASSGFYLPLPYVEPVFRPPAEANSLILQVTTGCSWNRCSFCEMYQQPQQRYRVKPLAEVEADLALAAALREEVGQPVRRIFLADGDAMGLPTKQLAAILSSIREQLPECKRVSSYCLPRNVRGKSVEELARLRALGLRTLYVGCESGDDEVLRRVNKGETLESSVAALEKLRAAGLRTSVMILHGLGGVHLSEQHVAGSAELVRRAPPTFLSTLVVSFPLPTSLETHSAGFADLVVPHEEGEEGGGRAAGGNGGGSGGSGGNGGGFVPLSQEEVVAEQRALLEALGELPQDGPSVIFRSDHASNYLPLKGTLPRDHASLMAQLDAAESGRIRLRPEWARGL